MCPIEHALSPLASSQRGSKCHLSFLCGTSSENRRSTQNLCGEAGSQLIMWSWSQEKWIHFHLLGLPLKLLKGDNYFPSSKYFLTSFSWKWQSGSAPGWQIQPQFDECNSEHSPWFRVTFRGSGFCFAERIAVNFGGTVSSFSLKT